LVLQDAFDNVITTDSTSRVSVRLQDNPGHATLLGGAAVKAVNGMVAFPKLTLNRAGVGYKLLAESSALGVAISKKFTVAAVTKLSVTVDKTSSIAGTVVTVTVKALDARNQVVTNYGGKVHFTSSDPRADLPADATLTNGEGTFTTVLKTAGLR